MQVVPLLHTHPTHPPSWCHHHNNSGQHTFTATARPLSCAARVQAVQYARSKNKQTTHFSGTERTRGAPGQSRPQLRPRRPRLLRGRCPWRRTRQRAPRPATWGRIWPPSPPAHSMAAPGQRHVSTRSAPCQHQVGAAAAAVDHTQLRSSAPGAGQEARLAIDGVPWQ